MAKSLACQLLHRGSFDSFKKNIEFFIDIAIASKL
jgi:hypothetical protein